MRSYDEGRLQQRASFLRRQFLRDGDLPFRDVLSDGTVAQALAAIDIVWLDRIYLPLVTRNAPFLRLDAESLTAGKGTTSVAGKAGSSDGRLAKGFAVTLPPSDRHWKVQKHDHG